MTPPPTLGPLTHVALTVRDLGDTLLGLHALPGGVTAAGYGSGLSFEDPDGLALELFAPPAV